MPYTTLFIDLDGTLYSNHLGLWQEISVRINTYLQERVGIAPDEIDHTRQSYFETYGTTLGGLMTLHDVDPLDYLDYVHDIPLNRYLHPNGELRQMLSSLPQEKWIFTNSDVNHARRVLKALTLTDLFSGIVDVLAMDFAHKPEPAAYQTALHMAGNPEPQQCILVDDLARNLAPARELGFFTVLVGTTEPDTAAHSSINTLLELPGVMPRMVK